MEAAEKYLEESATMFDEFLKENDKNAVEAIKMYVFHEQLFGIMCMYLITHMHAGLRQLQKLSWRKLQKSNVLMLILFSQKSKTLLLHKV